MSILCIGEMLIDFTPVAGMNNSYTANPGGAPANVAVSVARNEIKAGFLGKLGNDDFGRMLKKTLEDNNVEMLCPELTDEATTTLAFVSLDEKGDRSFTFARKPGADLLLNDKDVEKVDFSKWDIIHAGSVSQSGLPEREAVLSAIKKAKENGKLVSFDINFRDKIWCFEECKREVLRILPFVDLLKISDEELDFVGGKDNIESIMKKYEISVVVLTLGGDGAEVFYFENAAGNGKTDFTNGKVKSIKIPAMKVKVVDTTGAGDAYWGGFLSSLLRQGVKTIGDLDAGKLEAAGKCGAVSGGLCIQKLGGIPAIPNWMDIKELSL